VLATGARARRLEVPGTTLPGVHYVRTKEDSDRLSPHLLAARSVAVIGGGFIGLEVAAVARGLGKPVTVLEAQERLIGRAASPRLSSFYRAAHERRGVQVQTNTGVSAFVDQGGRLGAVRRPDGSIIPADCAVVGIGVIPDVSIAIEAGLRCKNGICVDRFGRTSDPNIFAVGDCSSMQGDSGGWIRRETVSSALSQARIVAAGIAGEMPPAPDIHWVWSDQYELRLQMAGECQDPDDILLRGDEDAEEFSLLMLKGGRILAIESVNRAMDFIAVRRRLAAGRPPLPAELAEMDSRPAFAASLTQRKRGAVCG